MTHFHSGGLVAGGSTNTVGVVPPGGPVSVHPFADPPAEVPAPVVRRRVRGLQLRAVPSVALMGQVGGAGAALAGVWLTWGPSIALIVGGVAAVVLGMLREAGKV